MKFLIAVLVASMSTAAFATDTASNNSGNSNNTINVNVKGCCPEKPCKPKTKVVTKTVEKIVEKKVEVLVPVEKRVYVDRVVEKKVIKRVQLKNRISLLAGVGPTRINKPQEDRVDLLTGPVGGLMYQRLVTERVSVGLQLQTNHQALGTVGLDF